MEINLDSARNVLKSIDQKLKDQARVSPQSSGLGQTDSVEISPLAALQNKGPIQSPGAAQLYGELSQQLSSLTSLIGDETGQQGKLAGLFQDPNNADDVRSRAQELLDGYFNVENTAQRIFSFAFSFYDGTQDREEFAKARLENIEEGFRQAEKELGGLADISLQTKDRIGELVNDFIEQGKEEQGPQQTGSEPQITS